MADDNGNDNEPVLLTTDDNPYNPFTQWDEWYAYDSMMGYNTPSLLARVADFSDELSEKDQDLAILAAMDSILSINATGNYLKVTESYFKKEKNK